MTEIFASETVKAEIAARFQELVSALNNMDTESWAAFYSDASFISAIAGTDHFQSKDEWVKAVTSYFSLRRSQKVTPLDVRVTPLAPDLAILSSEELSELRLKNGENCTARHVFTMIWKNENSCWKIAHSHESWSPA